MIDDRSASAPERAWFGAVLILLFLLVDGMPLNVLPVPVGEHGFLPWAASILVAAIVYFAQGLLCCAALGGNAARAALGARPTRRLVLASVVIGALWFAVMRLLQPDMDDGTEDHPVGRAAQSLVVVTCGYGWLRFGVLWAVAERLTSPLKAFPLFVVAQVLVGFAHRFDRLPREIVTPAVFDLALLAGFAIVFGALRKWSGGPAAPTIAMLVYAVIGVLV